MSNKIDISFFDSSPISDDAYHIEWIMQQPFSTSFIESYDSIFQNYYKVSQLVEKKRVFDQIKFAETSVDLTRYLLISFPVDMREGQVDISYFTQEFINKFLENFPQLVLHKIWNQLDDGLFSIGLGFVPIIIRTSTHPVHFGLEDSLRQQKREDSYGIDVTTSWLDELYQMIIDLINYYYQHKEDLSSVNNDLNENKQTTSIELLQEKSAELLQQNTELSQKNNFLEVNIINLTSENKNLKDIIQQTTGKREKRLQRELKKEKLLSKQLLNTIKKLEFKNTQLSKSLVSASKEIISNQNNKIENTEEWYQKKVIGLDEYDYLYQKVQSLEKMWKLNLKLVKKIGQSQEDQDFSLSGYRFTDEIQLFLMRNEATSINERVKFRKYIPFIEPTVVLLQGDYESLTEKAAYFDILSSENDLLEKKLYNSLDN